MIRKTRQIKANRFISEAFLLDSQEAQVLYYDYAQDMPIIDYHNHLSPQQIAQDLSINNISSEWLSADHYKWRAMRANGVDEKYITGSASDKEKFDAWAATVPYTLRNPLFHWTQLELKRYFDIDLILQPHTADAIYEQTNALLSSQSPTALLQQMKVEVLCTTDDPIDDLSYHRDIAARGGYTKVYPTFRPDSLLAIQRETFSGYIEQLGSVVGYTITSLDELLGAIAERIEHFDQLGCRLSDFGLERISSVDFSEKRVNKILSNRIAGHMISAADAEEYGSCVLYHLCVMYADKGWAQQFHLGAMRNNNDRLMELVGADAGCDSMGDFSHAAAMSRLFNRLEKTGKLAKTICYNLNPADSEVFATMMGNYSQTNIPGKMQYGSGWWFLDQKDGIEKQLNTLSNMGLLSRFVGMLTDSRSLLSFPRHEYFRRILCNVIAEDVNKGLLPYDLRFLGAMIQDICYNNAVNYFKFDKEENT